MDNQTAQGTHRLARRRYQRGHLELKGKSWIGHWREDELVNGVVTRRQVSRVIGYIDEYPTKRLAQRALDEILKPINALSYRVTLSATFAEFVTRWEIVLAQHKPSTQSAIRSQLRRTLLPYFAKMRLTQIQPEEMQRFVSGLQYSPKTVRNVVGTLRMIFKSARAWGYVNHGPFSGLVLPKAQPTVARDYTLEAVQSMLRTADEPWKTFFWVAAETGMRAGELCGLKWEDIDLDKGIIRVQRSVWNGKYQSPKSRASLRAFRVSERLRQHLADRYAVELLQTDQPALVFHTSKGTPVDYGNIRRRKLQPLLERLGIPRGDLHAFRHFATSQMDVENVPFKIRQTRLGHSDIRTTLQTYTHLVAPELEAKYSDRLGDKLFNEAREKL